jgi:putative SOS response-associated peptidase YedK
MPVILPQTAYPSWLEQQEADIQALQSLLIPFPSEELTAYPVSRLVNSPGNDYPEVTQAA